MRNKQEFNPYNSDFLDKIPDWIKVLFLKYWVVAATLFFFGIGNPLIQTQGINFGESQAIALFFGIALGLAIFNEYIIKNLINLMQNDRNNVKVFNLINLKGIISFVANLFYALVISFPLISILVFLAKKNANLDFINPVGQKAAIEPFTGGFVYVILDQAFVWSKNLIIYIIKKNKFNKQIAKDKLLEDKLIHMTDEEYISLCKKGA